MTMNTPAAKNTDEYLSHLPNWQQDNLRIFRKTMHTVIPDVHEEIKWGVPVFFNGKTMLFAMSAFKDHTKFNFIANGALLEDKGHLFNNGFTSKKSRAIDLKEGETVDAAKLAALVHAAIS